MGLINEHFFIQGEPYRQFVTRSHTNPYWQEIADFLVKWQSNPALEAQTSGTTGVPKILHFTPDQVLVSAHRTLTHFNLSGPHRVLMALPVGFIAGKLMLIRAAIAGWDLQLAQSPSRPWDGQSGTFRFTALVPHQLPKDLQGVVVDHVLLGGGLLTTALCDTLPSGPLYTQSFGMTETLTHVALRSIVPGSVPGPYAALPGVEFSTTEDQSLVIHDAQLLNAPLVTNDVVELLDPRHFYWKGRADHVINSGGIKFHAEAIEEVLLPYLPHPFFAAAMADNHLGQRIVLVVERGNQLIAQRLIEQVSWPPYMKPKEVLQVEAMCYTPSGKLRRKASLENLISE